MVGKIEIIISPQVITYLNDLVIILYKKEYFGFIESAEEYVAKIYEAIEKNLKFGVYKSTPTEIHFLGKNYFFYHSNPRTTWYIFFEKFQNKILVTGILNNHSPLANELK
ncbi:MAG: hypothetical protein ACK4RM_04475 [Flavobacterium sp.]